MVNEIKSDLVLSLKICAMLHQKKRINRILELIEVEKQQKLYNAIEMIEMELPRKTAKDLVTLFDFVLDPEGHNKKNLEYSAGNIFNQVYFSDSFAYNSWTKALVMFCSWKNNMQEDVKSIRKAPPVKEEFIVSETRDFILHSPY